MFELSHVRAQSCSSSVMFELSHVRAQSCSSSVMFELSHVHVQSRFQIRTYIYLITSILRNIASQLQCISASAAGTSAIPVTDEQYFSVAM